ncbi:MAG TPA: phosphopyruvate hydratase, partial [Patescibacteria group bacterium]|nr:phosphopyruvate hydratase [Patescibacteria group bacterium]
FMPTIKQLFSREILDSRGVPTVETTVALSDGTTATASSPSGTVKSSYEAFEMRDGDVTRYNGLGLLKSLQTISETISPKIIGLEATNQQLIDRTLIDLDGTRTKSKLGANTIYSISQAVAKAAAKSQSLPLFLYLRNYISKENLGLKIPTPAMSLINGGIHAGNNIDLQEFLVIPATYQSFSDSLMMGVAVYNNIRKLLEKNHQGVTVGDEGGFAPQFQKNEDVFEVIEQAVSSASWRLGYDIFLGIDAAAKHFYKDQLYFIKDKPSSLKAEELISFYEEMIRKYHILYLEDALAEDDWNGWSLLETKLSQHCLIVGDDLTATNPIRLQMALNKKAINGIVIKPNQIGTVLEALAVVEIARHAGLKIIVSHRSGDTNDDFIADFAVAVAADYVKFGGPARGERVSKYNRLLQIEDQLLKAMQAPTSKPK